MKQLLVSFFFFIFFYCQSQHFHGQYLTTIDTLLSDIEKAPMFSKTTERFNILMSAFNNYNVCAKLDMNRFKVRNNERKLLQAELKYYEAKKAVNLYINSLISYIEKYPLKKENYDTYNNYLKEALLSIRRLNTFFKKNDFALNNENLIVMLDEKASIKEVVKYTEGWKDEFINYRVGNDREGFINRLKMAHW